MTVEVTRHVPRKARAGQTWMQARMPAPLYALLRRIAEREQRSLSNLVVVLITEALHTRGETIPDDK